MKRENQALLYGVAAVVGWSTVATAFKIALSLLSPLQLVFFSTLTASMVLLLLCLCFRGARVLCSTMKQQPAIALCSGLLNPTLYYVVLFAAYDALPAQVAMSINYSWAIVLTFMAGFWLKQAITTGDWIAGCVCYLGVFVIATGGSFAAFGQSDAMGLAFAIASTFLWAAYWTLNIKDSREPLAGLTINFLIALPCSALLLWISSHIEPATTSVFHVSPEALMAAAYVGVVEMALGFVLWSMALAMTNNASRISNLIFLSPFASLVLIALVLNEAIAPATIFGLGIIILGLVGQQWLHAKRT